MSNTNADTILVNNITIDNNSDTFNFNLTIQYLVLAGL